MAERTSYDYVIVGAGSAGCVLARHPGELVVEVDGGAHARLGEGLAVCGRLTQDAAGVGSDGTA